MLKSNFLIMGRILGVDYGEKRIGLSISDPEHIMAVAKGLLENRSFSYVMDEFRKIIDESDIERLVFGLPLHLSGEESNSSRMVRDFAEMAEEELGLPVGFHDERFTTQQSAQPLLMEKKKYRQKKGARDQGAAVLILQGWLDRERCRRDN